MHGRKGIFIPFLPYISIGITLPFPLLSILHGKSLFTHNFEKPSFHTQTPRTRTKLKNGEAIHNLKWIEAADDDGDGANRSCRS